MFTYDTGSVLCGTYQKTKTLVTNSQFKENGAINGGVFCSKFESQVSLENCSFTSNFAMTNGIFVSDNHGYVNFTDSNITGNYALSTKLGEAIDSVNT